jgi:hypothetical protein
MRDWAYYIITPEGQSYQIENGMVVAIGNYKPLQNTPIGWQDISLLWQRSSTKFGLTRSFSLPLGFVIEGQSILTYLRWTGNFERRLFLLINRKTLYIDTNEYYFWYKFFYKGELDLSTYKYDNENARVDVNVMEGGLSKQLNANQDTVFTNLMDDGFIWVKMDGITINSVRNFKNPAETISALSSPDFSVPIINLPGENDGIGVIGQNQIETDPTTGILLWGATITVHVTGSIRLKVNDTVTSVRFVLRKISTTGTGSLIRETADIPANTIDTFEFIIDDDITMNQGEQLVILMIALSPNIASLPAREFYFQETTITATLQARGGVSYLKAKQPLQLGRELTEKITGNAENFKSDILALENDIVVTSGDDIRGIQTGTAIKCSFNQYFNSYNVVKNLGCGIENDKIAIEKKEHFFQTDNPIYLGQPKQYKDSSATDYLCNTVTIGYPDVNIDNVNGKYAFNTSVVWSCKDVSSIKKDLAIKSDFKADPYEIELLRIKYLGQDTTDALQDNDVYFLKVDLSAPETLADGRVVYPLYRQAGITITGVPNGDTVFNIDLSPRRLINYHSNWIGGFFAEFQSSSLHFESTQRNRHLVANGIDEDADVPISSLGAPLFKPVNFDFQSPFIPAEDQAMNSISLEDWVITGGNASDTSDPYDGATSIKSGTTVAPVVAFTTDQAIPFGVLNELSFFFKLSAVVPPPTLLRVRFYKGATLARTGNASFNKNNIATYQQILINAAALTVVDSTITDFDRVSIGLATFAPQFILLDVVKLSIESQIDLTNIMDINPNRCFSFIHPNGKVLKGHSIKVGAAPNTEQEQGFLLLATGDTNLEDLII